MTHLRSRIIICLLKHRHLFRLQWRRKTVDRNTSIPALRQRADRSARLFGKLPGGFATASLAVGDVCAEWIRPPGADASRAILYFHGGGYVMGSRISHRAVVAKFAASSGASALLFDYRLAPEHPFPAALDDALAAYAWMLKQGHPASRIVFAGDSAGGGLCLATLLAIRDRGMTLPAAAVVLSPWTDLTCSGASYLREDPLAPRGSWQVFSAYYAADTDATEPLISPLYGDLANLPPLLIYVGENESMRDDSVRFAEKARRAGVDVTLHVGSGMVHCYPAFAPVFPEATMAMQDIGRFIRDRVEAAQVEQRRNKAS